MMWCHGMRSMTWQSQFQPSCQVMIGFGRPESSSARLPVKTTMMNANDRGVALVPPPALKEEDEEEDDYESSGAGAATAAASLGVEDNNDDDDDDEEPIDGITFVDYRDESQLESVMALVGQDLSEPYSIFTYRFFLHRYPQLCILAVPTNDDSSSSLPPPPTDNDGTTNRNDENRRLQPPPSRPPPQPIGCVVGKIDTEDVMVMMDDEEDLEDAAVAQNNNGNMENSATDVIVATSTTTTSATTTSLSQQQQQSQQVLTGYIGMLAVNEKYRRRGIGRALVRRVLKRMNKCHCTSVTLETEVSNRVAQALYQNAFGFIREELLVRYYLNWSDAYRLRLWFTNNTKNASTTTTNEAITTNE